MSTASDNSVAAFFARNKRAILATVAAGTAAAGAYYYYTQVQQQLDRDGASAKGSKKKSKKKSGSKKKQEKKTELATETPVYPITASGEPDLSQLDSYTPEQRETYALALKDKGNELFKEKAVEEAIKYYQWALEFKKDPVFYANISACYVSLNDFEKVLENCNKALELKPDYSKVLLRRANTYENMENFADAMFDLSVLSLNNDFSGASIEPMLERNLNKQAMKMLKERLENTQDKFEQPLPSDTSMASFFGIFKPETEFKGYDETCEADRTLQTGLLELFAATHVGFVKADTCFNEAVNQYRELFSKASDEEKLAQNLNEKFAIALEYSGIFKFLKNDVIGAQAAVNEAIKLFPRVNSYIYLALTSADNGESSEYVTNFDKALELNPNSSATYYHRGQLYFITQDYQKAKADFLKAKELDNDNIFAYIQLACLCYREGDMDECKKLFDEAREKFPVAPEVPTFYAEILADKGDFSDAAKQYDMAKRLEEAISAKTGIRVGVAPLVGKATVLARQPSPENFAEATTLFEEACKRDPRSEQAKVGLAQLLLQQEDVDSAIKMFEEAADLARTTDEKLQAVTFAEAAKVQKKIRADPIIRAKVEEALAEYRAQGMI
ncbi:protein channel TOM71 KNAG_0H03530 [Huiozyma naganishii CBS 8797]|uniref:TOM70 n=1 Tax=Huiozyma naganishii (strain ATCC MYA-139 / BCRC 22969 / CBS 8797 / KCTC 17520 / NBRC 10181 / NCYC 3082 / Yp74L-3) TaxID=1071383 RepID=J7S210_HUIN7|nr:hypothetical protein KNAG_0H03530 [Kazachstania naganishii CBS 8797]CCK71767.1 hypothetical protein KNAG_0H03530 [Kazachstania naganishii CBS 8797]